MTVDSDQAHEPTSRSVEPAMRGRQRLLGGMPYQRTSELIYSLPSFRESHKTRLSSLLVLGGYRIFIITLFGAAEPRKEAPY